MKTISLLLICISVSALCTCQLLKPPETDPPADGTQLPTPDPDDGTAQFDYWRHAPMHPANGQSVQFLLKAFDGFGIRRVELHVFEYQLYRNADGLPSKRRRAGGQWGLLKSWTLGADTDSVRLAHTYHRGFPARSNVEYVFRIINRQGGESERLALFDAGDSPWPTDKILLYATSRQSLKNTINICFFPDVDFGQQWNKFLNDVEDLVFQGYHTNNMIEHHKERWNFFYTRHEADGLRISSDFANPDLYPAFMKDSLIEGIDAFALLHQSIYADGSYMYGNIHFLAHDVFTSESYNWGTAVHETAHAIFNLSDEYEGCACFETAAGSNVFTSLTECQRFNTDHGFDPDDCTELINFEGIRWFTSEHRALFDTETECQSYNRRNGYRPESCTRFIDVDGINYFRSEDALCIMQDDGDRLVRNFQHTCSFLIQEYYDKLGELPSLAGSHVPGERENYYGYEAVVAFELSVEGDDWGMELKDVKYGVPNKNFRRGSDLGIKLQDQAGQNQYLTSSDRPDCVHIHGATPGDQITVGGKGRSIVKIPYRATFHRASCELKGAVGAYQAVQTIDLKDTVEREYRKLKGKH